MTAERVAHRHPDDAQVRPAEETTVGRSHPAPQRDRLAAGEWVSVGTLQVRLS